MKLEDNLKYSLLAEVYKNLLTVKQQNILKDFLDNNISISEIAEVYNSSRQAVNDLIKRTFKLLDNYEEKLKLLEKFETIKLNISQILSSKNFKKNYLSKKLNLILEVL